MSKFYFFLLLNTVIVATNLTGQQLEIWQIQGTGSTGQYINSTITTANNVVVAVGEDGLFIQTPAERSDNDPMTSDGIQVFTGYTPNFNVGDIVTVIGKVREYRNTTQLSDNPSISISSASYPLPAPIYLDENFPNGVPTEVSDLESIEGMLVSFEATASGPSDEYEWVPVSTRAIRPLREPGILFPGENGLPVWDGNPEIFWFDPDGLQAPNNRFLGAGMGIHATGVIIQDGSYYVALPSTYDLEGIASIRAVRNKAQGEITVGSLNALQLFPYAANYTKRLKKLAKYIVDLQKSPDILALQEVGNMTALQNLVAYIEVEDPGANYVPYLGSGNDDIKLAFLVKDYISDVVITELGATQSVSLGGILHDRPPLLLQATLPNASSTVIQVLNVHIRSLIGIESSNAFFVRTKRFEQSLSISDMIANLQNENLVVVGDFNAFEFSDGYVDVVNQIAGQASLGSQWEIEAVNYPPLTNHTANLPQEERYSFVFNGTAQMIDHCLSNTLNGLEVKGVQFARGNTDNPDAYFTNDLIPHRSSDHDGFVLFLETESPLVNTSEPLVNPFTITFQNPLPKGADIQIQQELFSTYQVRVYNTLGQLVFQQLENIGSQTIHLPQDLSNGMYFMEITDGNTGISKKIMVN